MKSGWKAITTNGAPCAPTASPEKFCTGDASPFDKFQAWAATVPHTLRNPLYHWTHLELKRYFGIDELLDETTADRIWKKANEQLATPELTTQGILKKFKVKVVCTTDDPVDNLEHHRAFARVRPSDENAARVPSRQGAHGASAGRVQRLGRKLAAASEHGHQQLFGAFLERAEKRHDFFHSQGCRLSDHGMNHCFADFCSEKTAAAIFDKARAAKRFHRRNTRSSRRS